MAERRYYAIPKIGGGTGSDPLRPAYLTSYAVPWRCASDAHTPNAVGGYMIVAVMAEPAVHALIEREDGVVTLGTSVSNFAREWAKQRATKLQDEFYMGLERQAIALAAKGRFVPSPESLIREQFTR